MRHEITVAVSQAQEVMDIIHDLQIGKHMVQTSSNTYEMDDADGKGEMDEEYSFENVVEILTDHGIEFTTSAII